MAEIANRTVVFVFCFLKLIQKKKKRERENAPSNLRNHWILRTNESNTDCSTELHLGWRSRKGNMDGMVCITRLPRSFLKAKTQYIHKFDTLIVSNNY